MKEGRGKVVTAKRKMPKDIKVMPDEDIIMIG